MAITCTEKWEIHKNSTHSKIQFKITKFLFRFFFYDEYLKKIWGIFFFNYFINAITSLHISSFIVVYIVIWHIVTVCYVLMWSANPPPQKNGQKYTFGH